MFSGFKYPWFLLLGAVLLLVYIILLYYKNKKQALFFPYFHVLKRRPKSIKSRIAFLPDLLKIIAASMLFCAAAVPYSGYSKKEIKRESIDIYLALDVSNSMLEQDIKPNRYSAASEALQSFIKTRKDDNIGAGIFASESIALSPLTQDKESVLKKLKSVYPGIIRDGTAIGMGIGIGIKKLVKGKAKSKVLILSTDGDNNSGLISPIDAALAAKEFGIKIYTMGIGNKSEAYYNDSLLKTIADITGGKFFNASNKYEMNRAYIQIDRLEKTPVSSYIYTNNISYSDILLIISAFLFLSAYSFEILFFRKFV